MDVSENSGTPKSSILIGISIIFTIHFGVPLFSETPKCRRIFQSHGASGNVLFHPFPDGRYSRRTRLPIGVFMEPAAQSGVNVFLMINRGGCLGDVVKGFTYKALHLIKTPSFLNRYWNHGGKVGRLMKRGQFSKTAQDLLSLRWAAKEGIHEMFSLKKLGGLS